MLTAAIERSDTGYPLRQLIWLLSHPLFWAALGLVIGPYLFYRGFRLLQRKRLVLGIPRSTVRRLPWVAWKLTERPSVLTRWFLR